MGSGARPRLALLGACALAAALPAAPAAAVDTIYWADEGTSSIRSAPADGSAPPTPLYEGQALPDGLTLDPSTGRIYWVGETAGEVRSAPLSGAGPVTALYSGQPLLDGLAVDPVNGRIYWASGDDLFGAPLAGGGSIDDPYPPYEALEGVAADVAGDRLYWTTDLGPDRGDIRRGSFPGGTAAILYPEEFGPSFVAVDSAAGGVWWTLSEDETIRAGTTAGAPPSTLYPTSDPAGIAADTANGRLFWATDTAILSAPIAGGGPVATVAAASSARGVSLLRSPLNTGAPLVSPTSGRSGTVLGCSNGTWSIGVPGAFLYRAPTSFGYQWQRDGTNLAGETGATHTAATPGTYTCTVTGTNQAGSTAQASSNAAVIADPVVTLSPDSHDFGAWPIDDADGPTQAFTVENTGGATAAISSLALAGPDAVAFELRSSGCGATLAAGARCEAVVEFDPSSAGSKSASLDLVSDAGSDSSTLAGSGTAAEPEPEPEPAAADLDLLVADYVVLHKPVVPARCRTSRNTLLRRCRVRMFTLGGSRLGSETQSAHSAGGTSGRRSMGVRIGVNRRGQKLVAPALGGVPVKLRAVGRLTDARVRRARNRSRLFAERHHLLPPAAGMFEPNRPVLLPRGKQFLRSIAARARRVDIVRCDGHAAELPFPRPVFAAVLALERAHVACNFLRRHGMRAIFHMVGHSNLISRNPGLDRNNPASWPPDRRSGITLIRN